MKDMLDIIHEALVANGTIIAECADRIKYYTYPETADTANPFLTLRPLAPPEAAVYGSNKNLAYQLAVQIDVQSTDRKKCKLIQHEVKAVMDELGYTQQTNDGLDEYFEDTKRFVDARRYFRVTDLYDTDY